MNDPTNHHFNLDKILEKLTAEERAFVYNLIEKDPLTGAYNRRKFDRDIELVLSMSDRVNKGSSLLMIDIDHFKQYNDTYGHLEGDRILTRLTRCIEKNLRNYDIRNIYRYGGEEFVILIPDSSIQDAFVIGERLRKNVKKACVVTVSIGVSHYKESSDNIKDFISNADKALYEAKLTGRDQVVFPERSS